MSELRGIAANGLTGTYIVRSIPDGGTSGQVLAKVSGTDYDVAWANPSDTGAISAPSGATSGQYLVYNGTSWVAQSLPLYSGGVS